MRVTLTQPISVDEVDAEIVVVDGCALGFVSPGQAPHVLHVDPGEPAKFGVQSDDLLLSIDGQETASLSQEKVAALLRSASCLVFKRPESAVPEGKDEDTEPPSDEEKRAPSAPQAAGKERSRSRRGRRHRESKQERPREEAAAYPPGQPPFWAVERGPAWPVPGLRGPPSAWMGNAPPPWHVQPGPPPGGYPPRPPPETWRGPFPGPPPSQPPPRKGSLRLERNEGGGVSVVVMQVPPSLNKMDVLNEYFGRFGPVSSLQINQMRHEAIVTFSRMEDAEEALRFPVLNDPSIGRWDAERLSDFGVKVDAEVTFQQNIGDAYDERLETLAGQGAGQRAPDDVPTETAPMAHSLVVPSVPLVASGNMTLESGKILEAKRKREELQDRRKALLSSLTDQLKAVLARINDPATSDRNREQLQTILASIKDKIHSLTPAEREDPKRRMPPMRPMTYQTTLDNRPRPAVLQLSKLPEEMRGPDGEAQLRDALGDSVEWIREWSEDGSACTVRFRDRRHAEAAVRDQQVWTWSAKIQEVMPFRRKPPVNRFTQPRHMHKEFSDLPVQSGTGGRQRHRGLRLGHRRP
ncbi:unnamed protein product [Effrenium voratum]|uniref:PDZ domain-containing protein n=1 Tax=Effrenium voratum TaxID=2562239 RepID=A0AA36HNJ7_9DINO|nr:unnamed protein product [Effrenium voratum]